MLSTTSSTVSFCLHGIDTRCVATGSGLQVLATWLLSPSTLCVGPSTFPRCSLVLRNAIRDEYCMSFVALQVFFVSTFLARDSVSCSFRSTRVGICLEGSQPPATSQPYRSTLIIHSSTITLSSYYLALDLPRSRHQQQICNQFSWSRPRSIRQSHSLPSTCTTSPSAILLLTAVPSLIVPQYVWE